MKNNKAQKKVGILGFGEVGQAIAKFYKKPLIKDLKCEKILTGPAVLGTQLFGGKPSEKLKPGIFDKIDHSLFNMPYSEIKKYAVKGASILKQIPDTRMIEIETGKGCDIGKCSFCTEPLKNKVTFRDKEDILEEILKRTDRFEHSGIASDEGGPEYPFAEVDVKYGIKHLLRTPTPVIYLEARGQQRTGSFNIKLNISNLPEYLYERITSSLDKTPTIHAYLEQSCAGK